MNLSFNPLSFLAGLSGHTGVGLSTGAPRPGGAGPGPSGSDGYGWVVRKLLDNSRFRSGLVAVGTMAGLAAANDQWTISDLVIPGISAGVYLTATSLQDHIQAVRSGFEKPLGSTNGTLTLLIGGLTLVALTAFLAGN